MSDVVDLLCVLQKDAADVTCWLALADALDEAGEPERAELSRLTTLLRTFQTEDRRQEAEKRVCELLQAGVKPCVPEVVNSIGMRLVLIPPGRFLMGSPANEADRGDDEGPQHEVEITKGFYLGVYPVTQEQWQAVMRNNPSWFSAGGDGKEEVKGMDTRNFPVEQVSWEDVQAFLKKLSGRKEEVKSGRKYRLPSEAEWEYSCRSGASSSTPFFFGSSLSSTQANFNGNYPYGGAPGGPYLERTCEVGSYVPNAFELCDMHGNVWEWCSDWYDADYYGESPQRDPVGPQRGSSRVSRGGSWLSLGQCCRSAYRGRDFPESRNLHLGFRVALVPLEQEQERGEEG